MDTARTVGPSQAFSGPQLDLLRDLRDARTDDVRHDLLRAATDRQGFIDGLAPRVEVSAQNLLPGPGRDRASHVAGFLRTYEDLAERRAEAKNAHATPYEALRASDEALRTGRPMPTITVGAQENALREYLGDLQKDPAFWTGASAELRDARLRKLVEAPNDSLPEGTNPIEAAAIDGFRKAGIAIAAKPDQQAVESAQELLRRPASQALAAAGGGVAANQTSSFDTGIAKGTRRTADVSAAALHFELSERGNLTQIDDSMKPDDYAQASVRAGFLRRYASHAPMFHEAARNGEIPDWSEIRPTLPSGEPNPALEGKHAAWKKYAQHLDEAAFKYAAEHYPLQAKAAAQVNRMDDQWLNRPLTGGRGASMTSKISALSTPATVRGPSGAVQREAAARAPGGRSL